MEAASSREPIEGGGAHARGRGTEAGGGQNIRQPLPVTSDPAPLGLAAFATTTFLLSLFNSQILSSGGEPIVFPLALAFGGLAQLLAGMWEFRTGNTFGATAFSAFGAFWISLFVFAIAFKSQIPMGEQMTALGWYLISWGIFTAYMTVASLRTTGAILTVFALLTATYFLLGVGNVQGSMSIVKIGGYVGLATAAAAWYASFAAVTNATFNKTVVPVIELSRPEEDPTAGGSAGAARVSPQSA